MFGISLGECKTCAAYRGQIEDWKKIVAESEKRAEIARLNFMSTTATLLAELNSKKDLRIVEGIQEVEKQEIDPLSLLGVFQDRGDPAKKGISNAT